jgi:hypothetical protein
MEQNNRYRNKKKHPRYNRDDYDEYYDDKYKKHPKKFRDS